MKNPKQLITLAAIVATCGLLLASCGGGSSGSSATTINGISVPPEPDATLNNATLAGVDSNNNGVRDDVERVIAAAVTTSTAFEQSLALSVNMSLLSTATSELPKNELDMIFKNIMCHDYSVYKESGNSIESVIKNSMINSEARKSAFKLATNNYGGGEGDVNDCN